MTKAQISSGALIVGLLLTATACGSSASSQPAAPVATASDAALACYSSDYKPPTEDLRSVSQVRPDGVWTATGSGTSFTVKQTVVGLSDDLEYKCNAEMQPNGDWTAKWYGLPASIYSSTDSVPLRGSWTISAKDLKNVTPPRNLSQPGHSS